MKIAGFLGAILIAFSASASVPSSERDALITFYNAAGGPSWNERAGWLGAAGSECSWYGVACDSAQTTIVEISLAANNLRGTISPAIGNLPGLRTLLLYDNALSGTIPTSIGQLSNLETIILDRNELTGRIPSQIGQAAKLKLINFDGNKLTGPLPAELGNLSVLEEIDFSYNEINGAIPPQLGQLSNLVTLQLTSNQFSGTIPKELASLTKLESLGLTTNQLTGTIPSELGALSSLRSLRLGYNQLEGQIPTALRSLRSLQELDLGSNQLSGTIPSELGELVSLRVFAAFTNQLSGTLPSSLFTISTLEELNLGDNKLTGSIPAAIGALSNLRVLGLNTNQLTGSIPKEIGTLTKLTSIDLLNNDLSGSIPTELGELRELEYLDLAGNALTGVIPPTLGNLTKLRFLSLYENALEGPIPSQLGALTELDTLYLTSNRLTGTIPDSLQNLKKLQLFYLGGNELTGSIPGWIGDLKSLSVIYFPANEFTGSIPTSIGSLPQLTSLYLGDNRLSGSIPREIGNLRNLGYLSLEYTDISGPIPAEFWTLTELVEVRLNDMALTGTLPPEVGNLKKVDVFLLSNNQLEGSIPAGIGDMSSLLYLSLGQNRFTGTLPAELGRLTQLVQIQVAFNALRGPIPSALTAMTSLADANSDFGFNALFANDATTRQFINRKHYDGNFEQSQTLTPSNVRVTSSTDRSAVVEWNLIAYTQDSGGYQVTATPAGGGSVVIATTASKDLSQIIVRNLESSKTYSFTVATVTHPHDLQANLLVSDSSAAVTGTTQARTIAPADVVLTEAAAGLVQVDAAAANEDGFTLTNFGDVATNIAFNKEPAFFTLTPSSFTLAPGGSQRVVVTAAGQPFGSYYGFAQPVGPGASDGAIASLTLLSIGKPAGTVVAQALDTRIEVAGAPGSDSVGAARFRNTGTAALSGIVVSDQPWVVPSTAPIRIDPGQVGTVNFTIVRSKRPSDAEGALTANLSLVYVDGSNANLLRYGLDGGATSGVSVTLVQVVDTSRLATVIQSLPGLQPSEVVLFAPGIVSALRGATRTASDVSILNAAGTRTITDLRIFFTPLNGAQTTAATVGKLAPAQSLALANVATNVYGSENTVGSLQLRSAIWREIAARVSHVNVTAAGSHGGESPVFRSDRSATAGQSLYLAGVRKAANIKTDLYVQETAGGPSNATIVFLNEAGQTVGERTLSLNPFGMAELLDAVPAAARTAVVRNDGGGNLVAYARVTDDASGDTWSVVDWSRFSRFSTGESVRVPFVDGLTVPAGGPGRRRRAVSHAVRNSTDITLFNPGDAEVRGRVQIIDANGRTNERDVELAPRQTLILPDAGSVASAPVAQALITASRGDIVVTARSSAATGGGTAVPVVAASAGLRVGQSQRFSNLDDSTSATVAAGTKGTFRTAFGLVETAGEPVTVRARLYLDQGRSLVAAVLFRDFQIARGQQLVMDNLVRSILGPSRESLGELHNIQVQFEIVQGNGAIVPFVIVTDNGTGDTTLRLD
jgi:Leucine-rich repeat (LRR) protein